MSSKKELKARITLKTDDLSNWNNSNLVLKDGEIAIANSSNDFKKVKLGDGNSVFSELNSNLETDNLKSSTFAQGYGVSASNYSASFGIHTDASGPYAIAMGNSASAPHQGAFVWNGDSTEYGINERLSTNGAGTFTINPVNDISGFFIGLSSLADYLNNAGGGSGGYALCSLTGTLSSGSMVYSISDKTVSTLSVNDSSTPVVITFPQITDGNARDFILRIEVYVNAVPQFTFSGVDESIAFDGESDWYDIQPGLNIISFTETRRVGS